jgi:hypothetical protein
MGAGAPPDPGAGVGPGGRPPGPAPGLAADDGDPAAVVFATSDVPRLAQLKGEAASTSAPTQRAWLIT